VPIIDDGLPKPYDIYTELHHVTAVQVQTNLHHVSAGIYQ